ncbi:MAG: extracellular solute-binding protein [Hyphomicrobiales bacterium]|nr:extracellular solute-binding protein [Hyphomicrobiales bacterium]
MIPLSFIRRSFLAIIVAVMGVSAGVGVSHAAERFITLASTTSTENSGLFAHILPLFTDQSGIDVRVIAVGTGQAIRLAERGDADVLLVHHRPSEEKFVKEGFGLERFDVMYNDFVFVGPADDPAGVRGMEKVTDALNKIASTQSVFVSRGDDSGTHKRERSLWQKAGVAVAEASGTWYRETGSGMGATLNTASALSAYTLSDRGTWVSFRNKGDLELLVEGDPLLFNPYGVIVVNPKKHPHVKVEDAQAFVNWLVSPAGQSAIGSFRVEGQQLFHPSAPVTGLWESGVQFADRLSGQNLRSPRACRSSACVTE